MFTLNSHFAARSVCAMAMAMALSGCGNTLKRLSQVGEEPPLTEIQNPTQAPNYRPVSLPMPVKKHVESKPNSLWRPGARAFFRDQRASQIGDILTVVINIDDKANVCGGRHWIVDCDKSIGADYGQWLGSRWGRARSNRRQR